MDIIVCFGWALMFLRLFFIVWCAIIVKNVASQNMPLCAKVPLIGITGGFGLSNIYQFIKIAVPLFKLLTLELFIHWWC